MPLIQSHRNARLSIDGHSDGVLAFRRMSAFERMSQPFEYRVLGVIEEPIEKVDDLLGKKCCVDYRHDQGTLRYFHGRCAQITLVGGDTSGHYLYQLILRPDFWFLSHNRDCRIYQNKDVQEIISDVLQRNRITPDFKLEASYVKRDYCVQYRESDFDFVSRLMEEEGIFYFFKHEENSHKMVIADNKAVHAKVPGYEQLPYYPPLDGGTRREDHLDEWIPQHGVGAAAAKLADFNFEKPQPIVEAKTSPEAFPGDAAEVLDYPGGFLDQGEAKRRAEQRLLIERALRVTVTAAGDAIGLVAGAKFTLENHPVDAQNADYVVVEARHHIEGDAYHSGGAPAGRDRVDIIAIPEATAFRKAMETPRPTIVGVQTALVTGTAGEEIDTDKFGRIRVVFHWDTHGRDAKPTSCWIRVAQSMAGKSWGAVFIPRVGQEVLVEFIDGNPDRPIVTGVVYNGDQAPPYSLPGEKTKSTWKTNSSKGGGGFNEIRFEDKKGSEEIYIHSQKDQNVVVLNNLDSKIKNDETRTVTNNRTTTLEKGDETLSIKMGNRAEELEMGNDSLRLKMGNQSTKLDLGKQDTEALQSIEFKVGQSSVKIDQMGVTIKGMMIKIEGTVMTEVKGLMTNVEASALLIAKGPITLIN